MLRKLDIGTCVYFFEGGVGDNVWRTLNFSNSSYYMQGCVFVVARVRVLMHPICY